jgi:hypothetical protein
MLLTRTLKTSSNQNWSNLGAERVPDITSRKRIRPRRGQQAENGDKVAESPDSRARPELNERIPTHDLQAPVKRHAVAGNAT